MRLIRLAFGALGPFPGEHVLDLDELGASGLFLLEGPTGAGKSTLIDAVVFALYGKVASAGASEDRLRSAHAAPEAETYVELTFSTGAGLFRVRRTPAFERPKQRGSGTTTQQASVRLWKLTSPDAPGEVLATRIDEAGLELQRIVGLDRTQFVQTVVLPQGEFAAFLRADPEHRRGLLQKVFGTEVYDRVQQRLERMRADARAAVTAAEQSVAREVARFVGAAGEPVRGLQGDEAELEGEPVDAALAEAEPDEAVRLAGRVHDRLAEAATRSADAVARAAERVAAARQERDRVRELVARVERRAALRDALADLEAAEPAQAELRTRWDAAQVADRLWPWVQRWRAAADDVAEAAAAHEAARSGAGDDLRAVVGEGEPEVALKALAAEIERCVAQREGLKRALDLEAGLPERRENLTSRAEAQAAAALAVQREAEALEAVPVHRAELVRALEAARSTAAGLADARLARSAVLTRLEAARELSTLAAQLETAEAHLAERRAAASAAVAALARAHEARIAGIAGELATALVPGEPCMVCGSTEHPSPAVRGRTAGPATDGSSSPEPGGAGGPEALDVAAAEDARQAAERALQEAATAAGVLRERLTDRRAVAGAPLDEVERLAAAAEEAVRVTVLAGDDAARIDSELSALDRDVTVRRDALADRTYALALDRKDLEREQARLASDEVEVLAAADGEPSVRARDELVRRRLAEARTWSDALRALVAADERHRRAEHERDAELDRAGVLVDDVLRDRLGADAAAQIRRALDAHAAELARVTGALAEPDLAGLPDAVDPAGPGAAEAELAAAEQVHQASQRDAAVLAGRAADAGAALVGLTESVTDLANARAAAAPVVRMANVATASGGEGALTLATYVLGQRFADLVSAANARLVGISDGRYELVRSTEREAVRTRRLGLAMQVLDHRTGTTRDPRTLSGGETFYVSLCLALGLADVVTAEAGGVELGTLLIDEGFGALDAETLEVVLAELSRLRDGGRVVGVVSHVDALKGAIAERIEVRRRADGASTLTVRA